MELPSSQPEDKTSRERVAVYYDFTKKKAALAASTGVIAFSSIQRASELAGVSFRNKLPEAVNFPDHIANTADTFAAASAAMLAINALRVARGRGIVLEDDPKGYEVVDNDATFALKQRRQAAIVLGGSLALNGIVESNFFNEGNYFSADKVDILYGLIGGLLAYLSLKPTTLDEVGSHAVIQKAVKKRTANDRNDPPFDNKFKKSANRTNVKHFTKRKRKR